MKRILIIAATLALLAILAVPMAAFADDITWVNGEYKAATISVTPPPRDEFWCVPSGRKYNRTWRG
jgi:hypothetical protein